MTGDERRGSVIELANIKAQHLPLPLHSGHPVEHDVVPIRWFCISYQLLGEFAYCPDVATYRPGN
ncbi:hypothetical protein JTM47_39465, partial [Pseudomonas aeruginosa]|nr:hypothetical protein [Pseudomonas aeruginosa]